MQTTVRQELEMFYRMSGIFIQMLLHDAEQQNSTLRADVNYMENYKALEDIKEFEQLQLSGGTAFSLQKKATVTSKLPTLGSALYDPSLNHEVLQLRTENENLKKMMGGLQSKFTQMMQSKSVESESLGAQKDSEADVVELENKLSLMEGEKLQAKEQAEHLRQELFNVKDEMKKKVN